MIRLFARSLGFVLLAGGFAQLVVDGTRSIAAGALLWTPLGALIEAAAPGRLAALGPRIAGDLHPLLWHPVATGLLGLPACLALALLGAALLLAGRKKPDDSPGLDQR
ncbi:MAG: hypothetical protein JNK46_00630 [Methylobacteriaceae bacterium]|nr:hypothetical protein [Methylobacteriaceae bacterium]